MLMINKTKQKFGRKLFQTSVCSYRKRKADEVDGVSKKQKKDKEDENKKLEAQLKVPFLILFPILE